MRRSWLFGSSALLVAAGIAAAVAVTREARRDDTKPAVVLEFLDRELTEPRHVALPRRLQFSGPLVAPQSAVVRSKAAGTLLSLEVAEGSRVRAGQPLGRLDLAELDSRLAERGAMVESARALLAQAERSHESNRRLADQQFISPNALDASRAQLDTARAQLRAAEAQAASLRVTQRDAALVAPIDGIVAKRHAVPGEKLAAEQPVATIVDLRRLELAGTVGTHEVALLAPGLPLQVEVEGTPAPVAARLDRIAPAAEAGTRAIVVTAAFDNPGERFRAGQYALAQAVLDDPQPRLVLPLTAVVAQTGQEYVWLLDGGVLARRAVTTGRRDEALGVVEVLQGVAPGARVLAARFDNLREGAKAAVVATRGGAAASAAASR